MLFSLTIVVIAAVVVVVVVVVVVAVVVVVVAAAQRVQIPNHSGLRPQQAIVIMVLSPTSLIRYLDPLGIETIGSLRKPRLL